jgi:hypothetical protein
MPKTDTGKVLNIRGITEDTHLKLREYSALSGLSQAKALNQALEIAIAFDDLSGLTKSKTLHPFPEGRKRVS